MQDELSWNEFRQLLTDLRKLDFGSRLLKDSKGAYWEVTDTISGNKELIISEYYCGKGARTRSLLFDEDHGARDIRDLKLSFRMVGPHEFVPNYRNLVLMVGCKGANLRVPVGLFAQSPEEPSDEANEWTKLLYECNRRGPNFRLQIDRYQVTSAITGCTDHDQVLKLLQVQRRTYSALMVRDFAARRMSAKT